MIVAGVLFVVVVGALLRLRRSRKAELAGLSSERPVFGVEPPARRLNRLKGEAL